MPTSPIVTTIQERAPSTDTAAATTPQKKIVVIGSGPVGIRFCEEYLKRSPFAQITVFGNEPYSPYNRVRLSSLLAGDIDYDEIQTTLPTTENHPNFLYETKTIREINTKHQNILDIQGNIHSYDKLVIATGSRPHLPSIDGVHQQGVYTFRNLKDAEFLYSRVSRARHVVVLGGGLLGLESAKALRRFNTKVTVIQQGPHLMNRQLDTESGKMLQKVVQNLNIHVIANSGVRKILGDGRVTGVVTRDKQTIKCDTVLVCAGITANIELARAAKIRVAKGISVNDHLETSQSNVYAIGECSEHRGSTYGLVNPGFEQAAILADHLSGGDARYVGSLEISRLKVLNESICSMGEVNEFERRPFLHEFRHLNKDKTCYRKIVLLKGRIIGAVGFGEWPESRRVQEAFQAQRRIWPWQILRFLLSGYIYGDQQNNDISQWPATTVVCQCNNICQGELMHAHKSGISTIEELQNTTGAGTVCGSCKPLLSSLLGSNDPQEKEKFSTIVLFSSLVALVFTVIYILVPGLSVSESVQTTSAFEKVWNDKHWKQVTGFTLLGLSTVGLLISLRKRFKRFSLGSFSAWRFAHIVLGVLCASILIVHTGFHLGDNLNQWLMFNFVGVIILGAFAGTATSISHHFSAKTGKNIRTSWSWAHIFFTWPLPVLIGFHILSVYYF